MTINPQAKRILCYGDSNTWGHIPHMPGRFPVTARWTGRLQKLLGEDFEVIEEGLGGRTTDLNYAKKPGRNGRAYLMPCLQSHSPLDMVLIMLGTNDAKIEFNRTADDIARAVEGLVGDVIRYAKNDLNSSPDIIIVSPIGIYTAASLFRDIYMPEYYNDASAEVLRGLAGQLQKVADQHHCYFVDAAKVAQPGDDGIHMDEEGHHALAAHLAGQIKEWV